jgi:RNA polymerase sigma factor (sigma-70 family)
MKSARYTDDKLIKQFNKGERAALARVYDMWFSNLCYFAYRLTGDLAEAEDITVTALQILLSRHSQFETMTNIKAFLYITVRNRCLDYINYVKRQKASHKELHEIQGDTDDFVLGQMIRTELMNKIYQEIERLPFKRKEVFKLFYIEGLDVSTIAQKLKMTPGAVSTTKSRALEQLRNILFDKKLLPATGMILILKQLYNYSANSVLL